MSEEKEYKINIDPRILELLGPSLYTNIYYILAELIANAYDANARNVYIIQEDDTIIVEDDGNGMSYSDGDVNKYLRVAEETRQNNADAYVKGSDKKRKKMGRKGVGKLAALSVSENVKIHTIKDEEKSGFILSRHVADDHLLEPINESEIKFQRVSDHGTSIVMQAPQYNLHKGLDAIANNLLKIFPLVDSDFRIHVIRGGSVRVIDSFEKEIIRKLGGLIIIGEEFNYLAKHFHSGLVKNDELKNELLITQASPEIKIKMKNKAQQDCEHNMQINGWIGVYRSTRGQKLDKRDFPDNFLSLLSNKKLGEFNILDAVGKNALNEVYVVGQLHIELFEETSLPDMALSNRQGYKTDDVRYKEVINYVRDTLLPKATSLRTKYARFLKDQKDQDKNKKALEREQVLKRNVDKFKDKASRAAARRIANSLPKDSNIPAEDLESLVVQAINTNLPDLGIKKSIDDNKRKILLSHTKDDKQACDFIYQLLINNNVPASHIIYTNCDDAESRIPEEVPGVGIFDYLRQFFVDSYSTQKIHVIYVTSENMASSWGAVSEVGAGWITQQNHDIINLNDFTPKKPLNIDAVYANVTHDTENNSLKIENLEADVIASKIIKICNHLGYTPKDKSQIIDDIKSLANVG